MRNLPILIVLCLQNLVGFTQSRLDEINVFILTQKYNEALQSSNKLIEDNPNNAYYHYQQAVINKLLFRFPEAINSIKQAIELDSENMDYLSEYGTILSKREKEREAAKLFETVLENDPNHIYSGIWLSNYYLKEKKFEEAYNLLNHLYELDSTNGYFARNLGLCSIKIKNKENSIKWLSEAIQLDSTDIKAYEYLALVYTSLEKFDLAIGALNKATRIDPENKELFIKLGDVHVMRNHNYQAIPVYLKALELDPKDEFVAKSLGLCYFKVEKLKEAKYYLKLAKNYGLVDMQLFECLGQICSQINQPDSSTIYFNEALKLLKPDNGTIFSIKESIGRNYYSMDNFEKAIEIFNEALELDLVDEFWISYKKNKLIIDIAAIYQDKLNNKFKAIEYYEKVIEPEISININYYNYAQQQITKLKEELFFEGKL